MGKDFFPPDPKIPSRVTKEEWLFVYPPDDNDSECKSEDDCKSSEEEYSQGKWMLFHDSIELSPSRGMTRHDYAWQFIMRLVENNCSSVTGLISANCSTAWMGKRDADPSSTQGVICCYTIDYHDKRLAKKAADAIRKVYDYPKNMFYKTDDDTRAMKYRHLGSKYVSMYKHTNRNQMFERDPKFPYYWNIVRV